MLVACATVWKPFELRTYHRTAPIEGAEQVGTSECGVCHEDAEDGGATPEYHGDCESCHGAGSLHADSEEVAEIRFPSSADCLACHESGRATHLDWAAGDHARSDVICSDCHNPHNREPLNIRQENGDPNLRFTDSSSSLCTSCHPDVASRFFLPSHHPVREGMMGCTDCHSPHGDRRTALGVQTAQCASCHQDHAGPWVYEHVPVAEDCTLCHEPHGTSSYNLLDTSQPAICLSCHAPPDDRHFLASGEAGLSTISRDRPWAPPTRSREVITSAVGRAFYTRCTDCHGAIHGSYQDHNLRR